MELVRIDLIFILSIGVREDAEANPLRGVFTRARRTRPSGGGEGGAFGLSCRRESGSGPGGGGGEGGENYSSRV